MEGNGSEKKNTKHIYRVVLRLKLYTESSERENSNAKKSEQKTRKTTKKQKISKTTKKSLKMVEKSN